MSEPKEIPSAMLGAARTAILMLQGNSTPEGCDSLKHSPYAVDRTEYADAEKKAKAALEAAGVSEILADRERIGLVLFQNGYDNGYTTDGAVEAIEMMAARIAGLEATIKTLSSEAEENLEKLGC